MIYDQWSIIKVLFPFIELNHAKPRPALVLSKSLFSSQLGKYVAVMITSSNKTLLETDFIIKDLVSCGLYKPSMIRFKIFTIDNEFIDGKIGQLSYEDQNSFKKAFHQYIL